MVESGLPAVVVSGFAGLLAPAHTPPAIVSHLHGEVVKMSRDPDFIKRCAAFDMNPVASTPQAFVRYMQEEIGKWAKVIKTAGIHVQWRERKSHAMNRSVLHR